MERTALYIHARKLETKAKSRKHQETHSDVPLPSEVSPNIFASPTLATIFEK